MVWAHHQVVEVSLFEHIDQFFVGMSPRGVEEENLGKIAIPAPVSFQSEQFFLHGGGEFVVFFGRHGYVLFLLAQRVRTHLPFFEVGHFLYVEGFPADNAVFGRDVLVSLSAMMISVAGSRTELLGAFFKRDGFAAVRAGDSVQFFLAQPFLDRLPAPKSLLVDRYGRKLFCGSHIFLGRDALELLHQLGKIEF